MTSDDFIAKLSTWYKAELDIDQVVVYKEKLFGLTGIQIKMLYTELLDHCKFMPKIADIHQARTALNLYRKEDGFQPHRWKVSNCHLCRGEGRLIVIWMVHTGRDENGDLCITESLDHIAPYGAMEPVLKDGTFRSLFRCYCLAGESPTIPKSWPRWNRDIQPVRVVR